MNPATKRKDPLLVNPTDPAEMQNLTGIALLDLGLDDAFVEHRNETIDKVRKNGQNLARGGLFPATSFLLGLGA